MNLLKRKLKMAKVLLDKEPSNLSWNKRLFMKDQRICLFTESECNCVSDYYDSMYFEFDKCECCTVKY